jgi:hypothetical protein
MAQSFKSRTWRLTQLQLASWTAGLHSLENDSNRASERQLASSPPSRQPPPPGSMTVRASWAQRTEPPWPSNSLFTCPRSSLCMTSSGCRNCGASESTGEMCYSLIRTSKDSVNLHHPRTLGSRETPSFRGSRVAGQKFCSYVWDKCKNLE